MKQVRQAPKSHSGHGEADLLGPVIILLAAGGFSAKAILVKLAYVYRVDVVTLLALRMLLSLPFFLAMAWRSSRDARREPLTRREWLPVWFMSEGIRRVGSSRASMIGTVGPILTIGMGYFFLDEPIALVQMAGAVLVLAGVAVISMKRASQ